MLELILPVVPWLSLKLVVSVSVEVKKRHIAHWHKQRISSYLHTTLSLLPVEEGDFSPIHTQAPSQRIARQHQLRVLDLRLQPL